MTLTGHVTCWRLRQLKKMGREDPQTHWRIGWRRVEDGCSEEERVREKKKWGKGTLVLPQEASSHSSGWEEVFHDWIFESDPPPNLNKVPGVICTVSAALCMNIGVRRVSLVSTDWVLEGGEGQLKRRMCNYAPGTTAEKIKKRHSLLKSKKSQSLLFLSSLIAVAIGFKVIEWDGSPGLSYGGDGEEKGGKNKNGKRQRKK